MGITPIKDAAGLQDMMIPQLASEKNADNSGGDFKSIWNSQAKEAKANDRDLLSSVGKNVKPDHKNTSDNSQKNGIKASGKDSASKTDNSNRPDSASKTDVKGKGSPDKTADNVNDSQSDGMLKDEEIVSATEVLASKVASLTESLAEMLDISTDELKEMLATEGIEGFDILDKDVFSAFMLKTLGAEDQLSLLTNEEDYAVYSSGMDLLDAVLGSVAGSFDMKISELLSAVKESVETNADISALGENIPDLKASAGDGIEVREGIADRTEKEPVTRFVRNSEGDLEQVDINSAGGASGNGKVVMNARETSKQNRDSDSRGDERGAQNLANIQLNNQPEVRPEIPVEEARPVFSTNAQEIADQIMDRMKTVTDGEFSDVEMQLHPASLGNLQIRVTNNAGVITATFVTENEAVKSAVESQMMRLSDQLESQGVRVEAVEVTIAPKGFDTNSDQRGNEADGSKKGGRTRRINLGDEGELDTSDMEEEERIAAEMMVANGNTVDYTA